MEVRVIFQTARCVTLEIDDGSIYESEQEKEIYVDGKFYKKTRKVIESIYGLKPDREYAVRVKAAGTSETEKAETGASKNETAEAGAADTGTADTGTAEVRVRTDREFVTLNVRDFGARDRKSVV